MLLKDLMQIYKINKCVHCMEMTYYDIFYIFFVKRVYFIEYLSK